MTKPSDNHGVCPRCGISLNSAVLEGRCSRCMLEMATDSFDEITPPTVPPTLPRGSHELETTPLDRGRFISGTLLAGRYGIVDLIGSGGMGEVYRAEGLKMRFLRVFVLSLLLTAGCSRPPDLPATASGAGCIETYDPSQDYFPHKTTLEFATHFSVEYHRTYKVVSVRNPAEDGTTEKYVLLQCGAPRPTLEGDLASAPVIPVPMKSLFAGTAPQAALLADLDHVEVLTGLAQTRYVTMQPVLDWIAQGHVTEYASNDVIDTELVISKAPEVVMQSGGYTAAFNALRKAGIAVVANVEWQESTALGRAEWLKYMALFLNAEEKAQRSFDTIRDRYLALRQRTSGIPAKDRPRVMSGKMYRGTFGIAGGQSYVARMIEDAGGVYIWQDNTSTGTLSVDLEIQLARATDADVWINGDGWTSLKAMLAEEERYKEFKPFQRGNVWFYNRLVHENGGLDYWSRGLTRPDLILGDLIKIFHPELATDHEFMWYKQVPAE